MMEEKKYEHFVDWPYIVNIVNLLIEGDLKITQSDGDNPDNLLKESKVPLPKLVLEEYHHNLYYYL